MAVIPLPALVNPAAGLAATAPSPALAGAAASGHAQVATATAVGLSGVQQAWQKQRDIQAEIQLHTSGLDLDQLAQDTLNEQTITGLTEDGTPALQAGANGEPVGLAELRQKLGKRKGELLSQFSKDARIQQTASYTLDEQINKHINATMATHLKQVKAKNEQDWVNGAFSHVIAAFVDPMAVVIGTDGEETTNLADGMQKAMDRIDVGEKMGVDPASAQAAREAITKAVFDKARELSGSPDEQIASKAYEVMDAAQQLMTAPDQAAAAEQQVKQAEANTDLRAIYSEVASEETDLTLGIVSGGAAAEAWIKKQPLELQEGLKTELGRVQSLDQAAAKKQELSIANMTLDFMSTLNYNITSGATGFKGIDPQTKKPYAVEKINRAYDAGQLGIPGTTKAKENRYNLLDQAAKFAATHAMEDWATSVLLGIAEPAAAPVPGADMLAKHEAKPGEEGQGEETDPAAGELVKTSPLHGAPEVPTAVMNIGGNKQAKMAINKAVNKAQMAGLDINPMVVGAANRGYMPLAFGSNIGFDLRNGNLDALTRFHDASETWPGLKLNLSEDVSRIVELGLNLEMAGWEHGEIANVMRAQFDPKQEEDIKQGRETYMEERNSIASWMKTANEFSGVDMIPVHHRERKDVIWGTDVLYTDKIGQTDKVAEVFGDLSLKQLAGAGVMLAEGSTGGVATQVLEATGLESAYDYMVPSMAPWRNAADPPLALYTRVFDSSFKSFLMMPGVTPTQSSHMTQQQMLHDGWDEVSLNSGVRQLFPDGGRLKKFDQDQLHAAVVTYAREAGAVQVNGKPMPADWSVWIFPDTQTIHPDPGEERFSSYRGIGVEKNGTLHALNDPTGIRLRIPNPAALMQKYGNTGKD